VSVGKAGGLELHGIEGLPEIVSGDDLGGLIAARAAPLRSGDIVVVAQKAVSYTHLDVYKRQRQWRSSRSKALPSSRVMGSSIPASLAVASATRRCDS